MAGIASVVIAWNAGRIRLVNPPRTLITKLPRGTVFGLPGDTDGQRNVLMSALRLLELDAPLAPVYADS